MAPERQEMAPDVSQLCRLQPKEGKQLPLEFFQKAPVQFIAEKGEVPACFLQAEPVVFDASKKEVPIVDISGYYSDDEAAKQDVRARIASACEEWGFFQVVNHGGDAKVLEQGMDVMRRFYALPLEEKLKCGSKNRRNFAGYGRLLQQHRATGLEWRDVFFFHDERFHGPAEGHEWPQQPADYRETIVKWQAELTKVGSVLTKIVSENLGLPLSYLEEMCEMATVTSNYYPTCSRPSDVIGLNAHADASILNILQQTDTVPGLQILRNGEWFTVNPVPGALVVNVGDVLEITSNGKYQSLMHRGIVSSVADRISLLLALRPNRDTLMIAHPKDGERLRYRSVTFEDYLQLRGKNGTLGGKEYLESLLLGD